MPSITHLMRPDIAELEPYTPIVPLDVLAAQLGIPVEQIVKLDANENPYGASPHALAALANEQHYAIYPDPESRTLRAALSTYTGQPADSIICGAGADELIDLLARLFLQPGDTVIDCPPTFGMYRFDTAINGGRVVNVPRRPDFSLDLDGIERAAHAHRAKLLFLATPNNPTGNVTPPDEVARLLALPLVVVLDEAYIEFGGAALAGWVHQYDNLVVLRTFSKWAGLAGLRIGYGIFPPAIAREVWKIKQPYNVNLAAQVAALAAVQDAEHRTTTIAAILAERERLTAALHALPWLQVFPSNANFVLCRVTQGDARAIKQSLAQRGILIRYYATTLLRDYFRISVGTPPQTDTLLAALRDIVP